MGTKIRALDECKPTSGDMGGPPNGVVSVTDVFSVPGDFNLTLFDHLITEPGLNLIGCCNELNVVYTTDVIARSHGVSACVITFTVDGLSDLYAFVYAYS
ncbi:pyruvate decarboxylase 2 [Senna tora]|uniref:pyruvate decarboxylase n=1 Tax=Senna tora TaxID=362788 RepID=A0A834TJR6_9FABA|nr:pyruvate decarboxylase 2 [Senna tora]